MIDSPAYQTAAYLTKIISPALGKTEFTVTNSTAFVQQVKDLTMSPEDIMVSFDVTSLFTRVPTDEAVSAVCAKLEDDDTLGDRCELSIAAIRVLMKECLHCSYFQCQNQFYSQLEGAPMGLSLSVVLANAFMEYLEESLLRTARLKPKYWRRYVDDTFIIWEHGRDTLEEFHSHLNDACPSIQFTKEIEQDGKIAFLDAEVSRVGHKLKTKVYRKPTSSNVYMQHLSHHAHSIKSGVLRCLAKRGEVVCSDAEAKAEEMNYLRQVFRENGYPERYVSRAMGSREEQNHAGPPVSEDQRQDNQQDEERARPTYVSVPYLKGVSERIGRVLAPFEIKIGHSSKPNLRNLLVKVKDSTAKEHQKGVVYKTSCDCGATYIGETGRPKHIRLKEHVAAIRLGRTESSPLAEHWLHCDQSFNPGAASTLAVESTWSRRVVREAIEIRACNPSLNQGVGKFSLSPIWDSILRN